LDRSAGWTLASVNWQMQSPVSHQAQAFVCLTLAETKKLREKAKSLGVRTNALLLWSLNAAFEPYLASGRNRIWMIPVTLRNQDSHKVGGNLTGFFDVHFQKSTSIQKLNEMIDGEIASGMAYGGYLGVTIGRFIGKVLLRFLVRINYFLQIRTGVFSNLGSYGEDTLDLEEFPYGYPPVIRSQPTAAITMAWKGHQILCLQIHSILSQDRAFANQVLASWKANLLS
jgi:hypothetical protein